MCLSVSLSACLSIYLSNYLRFYVVATFWVGGLFVFVSNRSNSPKFKVTLSVSFSLLLLSSFAYVCHFCLPGFLLSLCVFCASTVAHLMRLRYYMHAYVNISFLLALLLSMPHSLPPHLPLSFLSSCKEFEMQGA